MSGTSLDGLDVSYVSFTFGSTGETFHLIEAETYPIPPQITERINQFEQLNLAEIHQLEKELGQFYASCVNQFIANYRINTDEVDAVACHGQTVLHQPEHGFTVQLGCGTTLAYLTGIKVINDFRTKDILAGGQGAPLVPIGDYGLFSELAESFLNIGGFCNITFKEHEKIIAFDCCPGNLPLNEIAKQIGLSYDPNGENAKKGTIHEQLLNQLNQLNYYTISPPKSLGTEWLNNEFYPVLYSVDLAPEDYLATLVEHIAYQLGQILQNKNLKTVLITGGGAHNLFLLERLNAYFDGEIIIPDNTLIDFKESIIFAYLGALYLENRPNTIHSVTGASKDQCCGVLHNP